MTLTHYTRKETVDFLIKSINREPEKWMMGYIKEPVCFPRLRRCNPTRLTPCLRSTPSPDILIRLGIIPCVLDPAGLRLGLIGSLRIARAVQLLLRAHTIILVHTGEKPRMQGALTPDQVRKHEEGGDSDAVVPPKT